MATVAFVHQAGNIEGDVWRAVLAEGDSSGVLTINEGNAEVAVHLHGTVGGSTVTVQGSLLGGVFSTVDDAYGVAMSYTAIGVLKPVGPALTNLKVVSTGGSGATITADVYVVRKVR
jgi:hypothetical protein